MSTHFHRADKSLFSLLILMILAVVFVACGEGTKTKKGFESSRNSVVAQGSQNISPQQQAQQQDWGENWRPIDQRVSTIRRRTQAASTTDPSAVEPTTVWTVVLRTFTASNHQRAAATMAAQIAMVAPELTAVRVHTSTKGSMVVFGSFDSATDSDAQAAKELVQQTKIQGRIAFPRAMLRRLRTNEASTLHPHNLLSARRAHPKTNQLYTLQVAMWGDFESGKLTLKHIRSKAQTYTSKLRAQGYEAYFYHDDDKRLSMVTIGVFDHRVIDHQSGILSSEVQELLRKFPNHLVNGEVLEEPIDMRNMSKGKKIQSPHLVEIPKL
ncbi:MAG: hypothetical protein IH984_15115 [Planctomycetes bacterium]|nr:hypothetical protein [Planctomycetota bacterium]